MQNQNEPKVEDREEEKDLEAAVSEGENDSIEKASADHSFTEESDESLFAAKDEKIKELEQKLEEANNRFLRTQADLDNYRRRSKQEREVAEKYRSQSLIEDLLPVLDNFQRALAVDADNDGAKSIVTGMEMVYRQLLEAMKKEGLEELEAEGKEFDPHYHQAVMQVEDDNFESNFVVEELQKGYRLKDRVIRPAMVKVNQ
jgi:molecular chaperone GrpE